LQVNVYTRYDEVDLKLNDQFIDSKKMEPEDKLTATFELQYQPGKLIAYGLQEGIIQDSIVLQTAGSPKKISLSLENEGVKADLNDLAYIRVEVIDENNLLNPDAEIPFEFTLQGPVTLAAVANGNPAYMSSFTQFHGQTYQGRCLIIARPTGQKGLVTLKVNSPELDPAMINLDIK